MDYLPKSGIDIFSELWNNVFGKKNGIPWIYRTFKSKTFQVSLEYPPVALPLIPLLCQVRMEWCFDETL